MSLNQQQILHSMAMSQLMMLVPELGESYAGKSANTLGLLTLMLAGQHDRMMQNGHRIRGALEALLASARTADEALQVDLAAALADPCGDSWCARQDRLMAALEALHAYADANDPALAARCRDFLVDYAESEEMDVPVLPA
jgi:hypothetical protein